MPPPPAHHGTTNRWRTGCRCGPCRTAHNTDTRTWRRTISDAALPTRSRKRLLRLITRGAAPADAAETVGVTVQAVYARRRVDPDWAAQLDDALDTGRDPALAHGTPAAYRWGRCRCRECRAAHHP